MTNLQAKVESLTTTNALMKEDLAIAKNNLLALYEENKKLRQECGKDVNNYVMSTSGMQIIDGNTEEGKKVGMGEVEELKQRLEEERRLRKEADNELEIQVGDLFLSYISNNYFIIKFHTDISNLKHV